MSAPGPEPPLALLEALARLLGLLPTQSSPQEDALS